ncbi:MAG: nucleoside deaminase [Planctomycetes bacterium]|nr:nucleoside deaminase [Planctomycetota bacterium]
MKKTAQKFMMLAIERAKQAIEKGQTPFGACIVKDEQVISCEHNTVWDTTDITAHAEINAIRKACIKLDTVDLSGCVIYSTCEPCPMCFAACHWARISKIVFGARIKDAKQAGFSELIVSNEEMKRLGESSVEIVAGFLSEENIELFKLWSQNSEKRAY